MLLFFILLVVLDIATQPTHPSTKSSNSRKQKYNCKRIRVSRNTGSQQQLTAVHTRYVLKKQKAQNNALYAAIVCNNVQ